MEREGWAWGSTAEVPELGRLKKEGLKFKVWSKILFSKRQKVFMWVM